MTSIYNPEYDIEVIEGKFFEGRKVTVKWNGKEYTRIVRHNSQDGLYILISKTKFFKTDIK